MEIRVEERSPHIVVFTIEPPAATPCSRQIRRSSPARWDASTVELPLHHPHRRGERASARARHERRLSADADMARTVIMRC